MALAGWARRLSAGEGSRVANTPRLNARWAAGDSHCCSNYEHILANTVVRREQSGELYREAPRMVVAQRCTPATAVGLTPVGPAGTRLVPQGIATIVDSDA